MSKDGGLLSSHSLASQERLKERATRRDGRAFGWGGKGVATGLGVLLAINPPVGALACLTWLIAAAIFRYSSLAALIAFLAAPIYAFVLSDVEFDGLFLSDLQRTEFAVGVFLLILLRHAGNIRRLIQGREPRIGRSRNPASVETRGQWPLNSSSPQTAAWRNHGL